MITRTFACAAALSALVLALVLFPSCSRSSKSILVVYSPHGRDLPEYFEKLYEEAHPGVDVQIYDMGSQQVLDRLRAEKANPQADLWWGAASTTFDAGKEEGLLDPYRPSWADKVEASTHDPQDSWYGAYQTPEVIVYNSDAIKPEDAPKDWDEILDAKWKNKVIIRDPIVSDTMRVIFGAMIMRFWSATDGPEKGYEWLRGLALNTKEYTDNTLLLRKLARQEALVSLWNMPDVELQRSTYSFPLDYNLPASGTPVLIEGIAIVKGCRHRDDAEKFYELVTSPEGLIAASEKFARIPVRTDLDRTRLPDWITKRNIKPMPIDWKLYRSHSAEWMKYWDANIRSYGRSS